MSRPLLLGHRGARAFRQIPENTMASFELCLEHGCDGFEFDVRCSKDGCAVICHDPVIAGRKIEQSAAHELGLPALDDVLQAFSSRAFLDIELKVPGLETHLIEALRRYPPRRGYVVSSFLPDVLRAVQTLDGTIPLGFLYEREDERPPRTLQPAWMIPNVEIASPRVIENIHAALRKCMVWTVNEPLKMQHLAAWGVDAIISDDTQLLVRSVC